MGVCFTSFYFKAKRETTKRRGKKRFKKKILLEEKKKILQEAVLEAKSYASTFFRYCIFKIKISKMPHRQVR